MVSSQIINWQNAEEVFSAIKYPFYFSNMFTVFSFYTILLQPVGGFIEHIIMILLLTQTSRNEGLLMLQATLCESFHVHILLTSLFYRATDLA